MWDVYAWRDEEDLFVESKMYPVSKDPSVGDDAKANWMEAAVRVGGPRCHSRWCGNPGPPLRLASGPPDLLRGETTAATINHRLLETSESRGSGRASQGCSPSSLAMG
jgi:hypothetical protein